jgi:hypothetical protein
MRQNHKIAIGFSLLFLAFMLVATGGGLSWGMTGGILGVWNYFGHLWGWIFGIFK